MAHDEVLDNESASTDTQDKMQDNVMTLELKSLLEAELSLNISPPSSYKPGPSVSSGRPKAVSAAAAPILFAVDSQDKDDFNEVLHGVWNAQRRTQSDGNLGKYGISSRAFPTVNNATPATALASPSYSDSALEVPNEKESIGSPPSSISVRAAIGTKPQGMLAMGESLLAGMVNLAGVKAPRGTTQKVCVIYSAPGPLYVDLYSRDDGTGALVKGFRRKPDGSIADAEASARVFPGDELVAISNVDVTKMMFEEIITLAHEAKFPLSLTFQCHETNRKEYEKQKMTIDTGFSNGPVAPQVSLSYNAKRDARLSQMTRLGSGDPKTSETDRDIDFPMSRPSASESTGGKFGISLCIVRQ